MKIQLLQQTISRAYANTVNDCNIFCHNILKHLAIKASSKVACKQSQTKTFLEKFSSPYLTRTHELQMNKAKIKYYSLLLSTPQKMLNCYSVLRRPKLLPSRQRLWTPTSTEHKLKYCPKKVLFHTNIHYLDPHIRSCHTKAIVKPCSSFCNWTTQPRHPRHFLIFQDKK